MAYKISGTLSDDADVYIVDETTDTLEKHQVTSAGAYEIGLLTTGNKIVTAVRQSDGKVLGYSRVDPEYYWTFEPSGSPYAWFDAAQEIGYDSFDPVGTFVDQISGRNLTQGTASKQPLYRTNMLNGLPILRWDGSNDKMQNTNFGSITQPATWFIVGRFRTLSPSQRMFTGNAENTRHDFGAWTNTYSMYAGSTLTRQPGDTGYHVFSIRVNNTNSWIRIDGSLGTNNGSTGTQTCQGLHVGAYFNDTGHSYIDIGDLIVYKGAEDPAANEAGLATKWGL